MAPRLLVLDVRVRAHRCRKQSQRGCGSGEVGSERSEETARAVRVDGSALRERRLFLPLIVAVVLAYLFPFGSRASKRLIIECRHLRAVAVSVSGTQSFDLRAGRALTIERPVFAVGDRAHRVDAGDLVFDKPLREVLASRL